jgi:hypothetical protein
MPRDTQTPKPPRWQPTWRRVGTTSVGAFLVVLGFLAGRMDGGADPGLADDTTSSRSAVRQKAAVSSGTQAPAASLTESESVSPDPSPPTTHSS